MLDSGLAPRSVGHVHRLLGRALRDAEIGGLIGRNPVRLVRPPRVPLSEMRTFDPDQARAILRAATGDRLSALYQIALVTGARQGELLALRWRDVDFADGSIRIARALMRTSSGIEIGEPKTASGRRTIPLGSDATEALRVHKRRQAEERLRHGLGKADEDDLVFATPAGTLLDPSNLLANSYYPLLERAGVPRLTFHALRHSAATLMIGAGTHIRVVAERLGHADPAVTLRVYSHVTPQMGREAAVTMDRILGA